MVERVDTPIIRIEFRWLMNLMNNATQQTLKTHRLISYLQRAFESDSFKEINERTAYGF